MRYTAAAVDNAADKVNATERRHSERIVRVSTLIKNMRDFLVIQRESSACEQLINEIETREKPRCREPAK